MRCCMDGETRHCRDKDRRQAHENWDGRDEGEEPQTTTINMPTTRTRTTMDEGSAQRKVVVHPEGMSEPVSLRRYHHHTKSRSSLVIVTTTACAAVVVL